MEEGEIVIDSIEPISLQDVTFFTDKAPVRRTANRSLP